MAIFSKEMCRQKLNTWLAAEESVATGQSYQIGTRMLTRADLKQIREELEYWAQKLSEAAAFSSAAGATACTTLLPVMCEGGRHRECI